MLMGIDGAGRTGQAGRFSRGDSSPLPRRTGSSHLPSRYPGQTRQARHPEHQGKLVLSTVAVSVPLSVRLRSG